MVTKQLTKETGTGGKIRVTTEELVKQICKEQGISVAKLAAALGQSRQNFYKKLQRDTLTAQEWQEAAKVLGVEFDQGFVLPDGTRMGVSEKSEKRTVLPLMGSAFLPGKAEETVKQFEDPKLQEIARGELYFFRAQAESCIQSVEKYQTSEDPILRLSADMLSTFANWEGSADGKERCGTDPEKISGKRRRSGNHSLLPVRILRDQCSDPYPAGRGNTTTGSLSFVSSGRAAAVRYQHTGTCGLSERGVCAGTGTGADCDGNDREDISDLDDLSELCGSHVSD